MPFKGFCSSAADCAKDTADFGEDFGCFIRSGSGICTFCSFKKPGDIVYGCDKKSGTAPSGGGSTTSGGGDKTLTIALAVIGGIVGLIVLIAIVGGVMYCLGFCPGQRKRGRPNNRPNNAGAGGNTGYYPSQYGFQNQFAVGPPPPPPPPPPPLIPNAPHESHKHHKEVPAPRKLTNENEAAPTAPKNENITQDIVIRLKVEVPQTGQ